MKQPQVLQSEMLPLKSLKANTGQIPGLPSNPRSIDAVRLAKLKESLKQNPEMLALREILVFKYEGENVVIGGNQRIAALQGMGVKDVPCKIIPSDTTAEQLRAYLIKDNVEFGSWVDEMLKIDWDMKELDDFGMEDVDRLDDKQMKFNEVQKYVVKTQETIPVSKEEHADSDLNNNDVAKTEQYTEQEIIDKNTSHVSVIENSDGNNLVEQQKVNVTQQDVDDAIEKIRNMPPKQEYITLTVVVPSCMSEKVGDLKGELRELLSDFEGVIVK